MAIDRIGAQFTTQVHGRLQELRGQQAHAPKVLGTEAAPADGAEFDPAATRLTNRLRGIQALGRGIQEGLSLVQTADRALISATGQLQAIHQAAVQATAPAASDADRLALQTQVDSATAVADAAFATTFNGQPVFGQTREVQVSDQGAIPLRFPELSVRVLADGPIQVANLQAAQYAIPNVEQAIERVGNLRSDLGSVQAQLSHSAAQLSSAAQNVVAATSADGSGNLVDAITAFKLQKVQFQAALKATAASLQTSDAVLELLK